MIELRRVVRDATPPPGARERVRAGIPARIVRAQRRRTVVICAGVLAAAACAVAIAGRLHAVGERAAPAGARLSAGVLELDSRARVLVADGASVWLVRDDGAGTVIRVERGTIVANVAPRAAGRPFVVEARDVRVEVVGTRFAVAVAADGVVGVRGDEGVVRVRRGTSEVRVGAGDAWPTDAAAPPIDEAARARVAFTVIPAAVPAATAAQPASPPIATAPASNLPAASSAPEPPRRPAGPPSSPSQAEPSAPTPQQAAPSATTPQPPAPPPTLSPYALARRHEDAGELREALAGYRAIRSGPEAEDALYAAGRLLRGTLAQPAAAHLAFLDYRRRYPDGRYARAVDVHVLDHALAASDHDAVVREADRFLAAHADDPFAPRFRQARAEVRIARGDCAGAVADLDAVPPSPAVTRLRARCER